MMSENEPDLHPKKKTGLSRKDRPPARWKFLLANRFPKPWSKLYVRLFRRLYVPLKQLPLFDELHAIAVERFAFSYIQQKILDAEGVDLQNDQQLRQLYREAVRGFRAEMRNLLRLCGHSSSQAVLVELAQDQSEKRTFQSLADVVFTTFKQVLPDTEQKERVIQVLVGNLKTWKKKRDRRRALGQEKWRRRVEQQGEGQPITKAG